MSCSSVYWLLSDWLLVTGKPGWPNWHTNHNESTVIQSRRQTARRLIIFRRTCTPAILRTPGHLILGVLVKFSDLKYARTPVIGSPAAKPHTVCEVLHQNHYITVQWTQNLNECRWLSNLLAVKYHFIIGCICGWIILHTSYAGTSKVELSWVGFNVPLDTV